jgi:hypothetical protein
MLYLDLQVGLIVVFFFFVSTWLAMIQSCKIGCHVSLCGSLVSLNADSVKQMALSGKCVWNNETLILHILSNWKNRSIVLLLLYMHSMYLKIRSLKTKLLCTNARNVAVHFSILLLERSTMWTKTQVMLGLKSFSNVHWPEFLTLVQKH